MQKYIKSPIFYMGNKYEILPQIFDIFPNDINTFYDLFGGSGVVSLNVNANKIIYNDSNNNIYQLLKIFLKHNPIEIHNHIINRINQFNLPTNTTDIRLGNVNKNSRNNAKIQYENFRTFYNNSKKNYLDLYTLTFYSFSNLIRFNSNNNFNMPFGNQIYNKKKHYKKIVNACLKFKKKNIIMKNENAFNIFKKTNFTNGDFIYLDPPYLNTNAIYNEKRAFGGWKIEDDYKLFKELDKLNSKGIKWCLSNVKENKGVKNEHLIEWAEKNNYRIIGINKNYSALGKGNSNSYEVCIINYHYKGEGFKHIQEKLF